MAKRMILRDTDEFAVTRFGRTKAAHELWLSNRGDGVGGSDMAVILGLNRYETPYELWLEKTGRVAHDDISGKWAVVRGNALEVELRRRFRALHPEWQVTDGTGASLRSVAHPILQASLDGWIWDPASGSWGVLEIKTVNAARARLDWRDADGGLRIPAYYLAQVTHYMAVTGWSWGVLYADLGEGEPVEIGFERDEADVVASVAAAEAFWGFVERDEPPALETGGDVLLAYPEPSRGVEDSDDPELGGLLRSYADAQSRAKAAKAEADALKDRLIVRIGDREGVRCDGMEATYRPFHRKAYTRTVEAADGRRFGFRTLAR